MNQFTDYLGQLTQSIKFGDPLLAELGGNSAIIWPDGFDWHTNAIFQYPESIMSQIKGAMEGTTIGVGTPGFTPGMSAGQVKPTYSEGDFPTADVYKWYQNRKAYGQDEQTARAGALGEWDLSKKYVDKSKGGEANYGSESSLLNDPFGLKGFAIDLKSTMFSFGWIIVGVALVAVGGYALVRGEG